MIKRSDFSEVAYFSSLVSGDEDYPVLNFFKRLSKDGYGWSSRLMQSAYVLINQCWSASDFMYDISRAIRDFYDDKVDAEFAVNMVQLMYLHWHNFLLVQMRESLGELYITLRYKEGKISYDKAFNYLKDMGLRDKYITKLLDVGSDMYYTSYDGRDRFKRTKIMASRSYYLQHKRKLSKNVNK